MGRSIRATSEDPDTAGLVGIDAVRANAVATAIAMVTVGIAGAALGMRATFDPYSGAPQLLFAFEAAVIGGAGSLWGTLAGGIVLALAQTLGAQLHPLGFLIGGHVAFVRRAVRHGCSSPAGLADCAPCWGGPIERAGPSHEGRALDAGVAGCRGRRGGVIVCLAFAPLFLGAGTVDRLTALFIYVILAAMWNALAGFGGLVSVGQQVFFGLGAYLTIRLADAGIDPFLALLLAAAWRGAVLAAAVAVHAAAAAAASSRSACG